MLLGRFRNQSSLFYYNTISVIMDSSKKHVKVSPEETANIFSKLFYCWILPFFHHGYKNEVQMGEIYNVSKRDHSSLWGDDLEKNWEKEVASCENQNKKRPSLKRVIFRTFVKPFTISGAGFLFQLLFIRMVLPLILAEYIHYFDKTSSERDRKVGWMWATVVIVMAFCNVLVTHSSTLSAKRVGMRVRIAVSSLIYRKLLKLNHISLGQTDAGQLVNLLSNDVQRFDIASEYLHFIWITPINIVVAFYIILRTVGLVAAVAGMGAVFLESVPIQGYLSNLQGRLRSKIVVKTDKRLKLLSEIISGIQVIKMYAWEKPFGKMVELCRKSEIEHTTKASHIQGLLAAMAVFTERLNLYVTVITLALLGKSITGDVVFSMAQLLNSVQLISAIYFSLGIAFYSGAKVSIGRIENFLLSEEAETGSINHTVIELKDAGEIRLKDAAASWSSNPITPTLVNIDFHVKPGMLCCVVGNIGSGKSSLLQMLLKELPLTHGHMIVSGKIAYSSQEPWLFVSSIRNNILFGKPYQRQRYRDVIKVCSMRTDFEQFPYGDKTLVGERGTSLSGGQRARVNLARAVYTDADIYLFDDPLSAVDTKVARHVFDQCIAGYLNGKTRILVTHQQHFLKQADLIVVIDNGKIKKVSTFNELSRDDLDGLKSDYAIKNEETIELKQPEKCDNSIAKIEEFKSTTSIASSTLPDDVPIETDELIQKGNIPTKTYLDYWRAGGSILFQGCTLLSFLSSQVATNATDLWLTHWINSEARGATLSNHPFMTSNETTTDLTGNAEKRTTEYYIYIYTIVLFSSIILLIFRSFLYYKLCMTASKVLHNRMFHNLLQAPMRFFNTNPSGRILNRFSKDMGVIDEFLPYSQLYAFQVFLLMCGILIIVFSVTPWMLIPTVVLAGLFHWCRVIYLINTQAIKRLEGNTKAPVFSHMAASLHGIATIRANNAEKMIIGEFDVLQDQHTSTWFLFIAGSTAFGFYLDIITTTFLAIVTFQFLIFQDGNTSSGTVGLVITQSMILSGMLQFGTRQSAEVANNMVSLERVLQYTKLEKEGPFETLPGKKPQSGWPNEGKITFKNTYFRYDPALPPVLKDFNIEFNSGEKIGIVGRTGAGKSTLIASLFRLAPIDGTISVDGVDIADIGLNDLRLNISVIPQEPILFSATLRYNLDPFGKHCDEVLWKALENVELKGIVTDLNQAVSEGGSNFSAGQRQLICLARAIVRNNKILVMDEATANVDPQTDALIQTTIRRRFKDCTVLTIAHRLNTIMDSDRVLVMEDGRVMEFDHPHILLQNSGGYFSRMLQEMGSVVKEQLMKVAGDEYVKKMNISGGNE